MTRSIVLVVALLAIACDSTAPITAGPSLPTARIEAVVFAFSEDLSSFNRVGATAQVTAVGVLSDRTTQNVTATCIDWRSDNTRVLTIDGRGLMTAQGNGGSATIATTCQSVSARGVVTVDPPPVPPWSLPAPSPPPTPNPGPSTCAVPPYAFDPPPNQTICRGRDGRFAPRVCCGG